MEDLQKTAKSDEEDEETAANIAALQEGDNAKSLICNECGKKFRNQGMATFHAEKRLVLRSFPHAALLEIVSFSHWMSVLTLKHSGHTDFAESTEEIAPLTEEEKKAKLDELRKKLQEKRANQALQDKETAKQNEVCASYLVRFSARDVLMLVQKIRMKSTRETQDLKEEIARKEQIKEAAKKRQEKLDDIEAKRRIKAKIEADKEERRRKAELAKAAKEGRAPEAAAAAAAAAAPAPAPAAARPTVSHNDGRLRLQTSQGNIQKTYPADTTLFEVAQALESESGIKVTSFTLTFPRKVYESGVDFGTTLREAGLVPSGVLIVK